MNQRKERFAAWKRRQEIIKMLDEIKPLGMTCITITRRLYKNNALISNHTEYRRTLDDLRALQKINIVSYGGKRNAYKGGLWKYIGDIPF